MRWWCSNCSCFINCQYSIEVYDFNNHKTVIVALADDEKKEQTKMLSKVNDGRLVHLENDYEQ